MRLQKCEITTSLSSAVVVLAIGSFSIDDGDGNDNATNKQFDWSSEENKRVARVARNYEQVRACLLYTSPSPRDQRGSRMPSSA